MPQVTTRALLEAAVAEHRGIGAFNVITLEFAEAIVMGAERAKAAAILQLSENAARFHGGNVRPITAAMRELADSAAVPIALHLDHVEDAALLRSAVDAGFSSVMFDAGRLSYSDNLRSTCEAADWAHAHGLSIEAELGYVGGKDTQVSSAHAPDVRTDPTQAAEFVAATGVDALAVAVGSSHAMRSRTAELDQELIGELRRAVPIPLVLHGSSGVPAENLAQAVASGIVKVNVGTLLSITYTHAVRALLDQQPSVSDPRKYLAPAREQIAFVVADFIRVISG
jgi:fructose-bisphosphate aldolase class II